LGVGVGLRGGGVDSRFLLIVQRFRRIASRSRCVNDLLLYYMHIMLLTLKLLSATLDVDIILKVIST
jgi:hypothetical protein